MINKIGSRWACENLSIPSVNKILTKIAIHLQEARRESLVKVAVPSKDQEWEYAGRTWSWPAGEEMTYFRELAPNEETVLKYANVKYGLEYAGTGTGRVVVTLPDHIADESLVAKLARYGMSAEMGAGRTQNRREEAVWNSVAEHPFLPVLDSDAQGNWLIMPQAKVIGERNPRIDSVTAANREFDAETTEALKRIREAIAPHTDLIHLDEIKPENIGSFNNRYWLLDYGRPPGRSIFLD